MRQPSWWFVGTRWFFSAGRGYLSFVSVMSLASLVLGVSVLIVVLSVMNGFDEALRYRILGSVPQFITDEASARSVASAYDLPPPARFAQTQAMVNTTVGVRSLGVYGIEPGREAELSVLPENVISGRLERLQPGQIFIGRPLAFQLRLLPGDRITLIVPRRTDAGGVRPEIRYVELAGLFEVGAELDYGLGIVHVDDLAGISNLVGQQGWRSAFDDPVQVTQAAARFAGGAASWWDWRDGYGQLFEAVALEKMLMTVLLMLITMVAAFSIVASLLMLVQEKRADIAILATMGMSRGDVMRVFALQGVILGLLGTAAGAAAGLLLAAVAPGVAETVEAATGASITAGTYFDALPVRVEVFDVVAVCLFGFFFSLASTVYPAWQARRTRIVAALHGD